MSELKENLITVFLVILIIAVIGIFGYAVWNIMQDDTKTNEQLSTTNNFEQSILKNEIKEKNDITNIINNAINTVTEDTTVDVEKENNIEQEENIKDIENNNLSDSKVTNFLYVNKYEERWFH